MAKIGRKERDGHRSMWSGHRFDQSPKKKDAQGEANNRLPVAQKKDYV
jgi:hypothetical protein